MKQKWSDKFTVRTIEGREKTVDGKIVRVIPGYKFFAYLEDSIYPHVSITELSSGAKVAGGDSIQEAVQNAKNRILTKFISERQKVIDKYGEVNTEAAS